MRPRVSWMTGNDDSILEYLSEKEVALPPRGLDISSVTFPSLSSGWGVSRALECGVSDGIVARVQRLPAGRAGESLWVTFRLFRQS